MSNKSNREGKEQCKNNSMRFQHFHQFMQPDIPRFSCLPKNMDIRTGERLVRSYCSDSFLPLSGRSFVHWHWLGSTCGTINLAGWISDGRTRGFDRRTRVLRVLLMETVPPDGSSCETYARFRIAQDTAFALMSPLGRVRLSVLWILQR